MSAWCDGLTPEQVKALDKAVFHMCNWMAEIDASEVVDTLRAAFMRKPREREGWAHQCVFDGNEQRVSLWNNQPANPAFVRVRITEVLP